MFLIESGMGYGADFRVTLLTSVTVSQVQMVLCVLQEW